MNAFQRWKPPTRPAGDTRRSRRGWQRRPKVEALEPRLLLFGPNDFTVADVGAEQITICQPFVAVDRCNKLEDMLGAANLDFQTNGNLVVVGSGRQPAEVRIYDRGNNRVGGFTSDDLGGASDIDAANGRIYAGTGRSGGAVELDEEGGRLRNFGQAAYGGVAVVGDQLWAGFDSIDRYDLASGQIVDAMTLEPKFTPVERLQYSPRTNSVLAVGGGMIFEIDVSSRQVVRTFPVPATGTSVLGITRGPGGHVFATGFGGQSLVFEWESDGTFVTASTFPSPAIPFGIGWAGNTVADLSITLAAGKQNPEPGEEISLTAFLDNQGPSPATGVAVTIPLPQGLTMVGAPRTAFGTYDPETGVWTVGRVDDRAVLEITVQVNADTAGREITVTTEVTAADQPDNDSTPGNGILTEDDLGRVILTVVPDVNLDWGDALGTGFPTRRSEDGARHDPEGATLGALRDTEEDGRPTANADGDDSAGPGVPPQNDEDGLVAHLVSTTCGQLVVDVQGVGQEPYYLNAWIDFSGNSAWGDAGEQVAVDSEITRNGQQSIVFNAPPAAVAQSAVARFRLSTVKGLGVGGPAVDGEVEDHLVEIRPAPPIVYVDDDFARAAPGTDPDGDGPASAIGFDAFATIQDGVNCVAVGGTVDVGAGTYPESVSITKRVKVFGERANTVVTAVGGDGFSIAADSVEIGSLKITGSRRGVSATGVADPKLSDVLAVENTEDGFHGTDLTGTVHISGGSFSDNSQQGIDLNNVEVVRLMDGVAVQANSIGVFVKKAQSFSDTQSTVRFNDDDGIRLLDISGDVTLTNTQLVANNADRDVTGDGLFAGTSADGNGVAIGGDLLMDGVALSGPPQIDGVSVANVAGKIELKSVTAALHESVGLRLGQFRSLRVEGGEFQENETGIRLASNGTGAVHISNTVSTRNNRTNLAIENVESVAIDGGVYDASTQDTAGRGINIEDVAGSVEIKQVTAGGNARAQLTVKNVQSLLVEDGSFNGPSRRLGLDIARVAESIVLRNVTANENGTNVRINAAESVTIVGGQFDRARGFSPLGSGLQIAATTVLLESVSASKNQFYGVELLDTETLRITGGVLNENQLSGLRLSALDPAAVEVTSGIFSNNGTHGIEVSGAGSVSLTSINANGNQGHGVLVDKGEDIIVTGGSASRNEQDGLHLTGVDDVRINDFKADGNTAGHGIRVRGGGDVEVTGGSISGNGTQASGSKAHGLGAETVDDVTTRNVKGLDNDPAVFVRQARSYRDFGSDFSGNSDGGVTLEQIRGDVLFRGTTVSNNDTNGDGLGAGIQLSEIGGVVRVEAVIARQNADGVRVDGPVALGIQNSLLAENNVGLRNHGGTVVLDNSQFLDNLGQDVLADQGGTVETAVAVSGSVYRDLNADGVRDAGEPGLPNVPVQLLDAASGQVVRVIGTAGDGSYLFDLLRPGRYTIVETQPVAYADGIDSPGTDGQGNPLPGTAGNDRFDGVGLLAGARGVDFNFGEGPLRDDLLQALEPLPGDALGPDQLARFAVDGQRAYRYRPDRDRVLLAEAGLSWQLYTDDLLPYRLNTGEAVLSAAVVQDQTYVLIASSTAGAVRTRLRMTPPPLRHANPVLRLDVDGDGQVTPRDALIGINDLNARGSRRLGDEATTYYLDVNGDRLASPIDVLIIVNELNEPDGEGERAGWVAPPVAKLDPTAPVSADSAPRPDEPERAPSIPVGAVDHEMRSRRGLDAMWHLPDLEDALDLLLEQSLAGPVPPAEGPQ